MHETALISLALILFVGIFCQWLAWRLKLPAIIFLLFCGILAGPIFKWLDPDQLFGDLLFPFVSLSVAVILFEGSLTLNFREIPGLEKVIRNLITLGVLISWVITTCATHLLLGFSWEISCLFGAIMVVTGPTVIMPMIRTVRPTEGVANVLQWEGILIDPIGAILAVLTYEFIVAGGLQGGLTAGALVFGKMILIGLVCGAGAGYFFSTLVRKYWVPQYLHNVIALALVCAIFAISNHMEAESGLLSVTVMGLWLANMPDLDLEDLIDFKESLSVLLISVLFILLAARMDLPRFLSLGWPALGVFAVIQFLVRPLSVQLCALGSKLTMAERHLLAWIAPRGIVAAAITALFAIKLETLGYQNAPQLVPLTFMVIIGTVVLQSATARPIARFLKVAEPEPKGFLIVGANLVARKIAKALNEEGFRVLLTDQNWSSVSTAKMLGLNAYWGNPVSEHAERHLDLLGIGHLLAISPHIELNALAAQYFRLEFEPQHIYTIRNEQAENGKTIEKNAFKFGGRYLFNASITYQDLEKLLDQGIVIKKTLLTDEFSFEDYIQKHRNRRLPLFAMDENDSIYVFTPDEELKPREGWSILALVQGDE